jgi:hypothetical protein
MILRHFSTNSAGTFKALQNDRQKLWNHSAGERLVKMRFLGFAHKTQMGLAELSSPLVVVLTDVSEHLRCCWSIG